MLTETASYVFALLKQIIYVYVLNEIKYMYSLFYLYNKSLNIGNQISTENW